MQQIVGLEKNRARDAAIVKLRREGVSYLFIRSRLNVSNDTIASVLQRNGISTAGPERFDWTEERISVLTTRWLAGDSASDIGVLLGCSKNAVIGKLGRLGVKRPEELNIQNRRHAQRTARNAPRKPKAEAPRMVSVVSQDGDRAYLVPEAEAAKMAPRPEPVTAYEPGEDPVLKLRALDCRFPEGEPGRPGFRFCCKPARLQTNLAGKPRYCDEHAKLCGDGNGKRRANAKPMHCAPVVFLRGSR
jgi:GcrA cell cycle regulator